MLQPIFDFLVYIWDLLVFWVVVPEYEEGIILRLGNYTKKLTSTNGLCGTGLHLKYPFGVDVVFQHPVILDTMDLKSQSLTTRDDVGITIEAIVRFNIEEVDLYLLRITDRESAFLDIAAAAVTNIVAHTDYQDLRKNSDRISNEIKKSIQQQVTPFGIVVHNVAFRTKQKCRTIRIINDAVPLISR